MTAARKIIALAVAAAVLCACTLLLWALLHSPPAPPPAETIQTPEEAVQYLASDDFAAMDTDDKTAYLAQVSPPDGSSTPLLAMMFDPGLTEDQRQQVMQNILPAVAPLIAQRLDEYEKLPPAEQTARLDAIIDRISLYRQANPQLGATPERLNLILQYVDPYTRAKIRKHIPDLTRRMQQRGLPAPPFLQ